MKHRHLLPAVIALSSLAGAGPAGAGDADVDKSPAFTIVGARIYDGERWLPRGTQVRVQHGLVLAVGPDVGLARGGIMIDAAGKTLLPEPLEAPQAQKLQSGHGAIIAGAHADLRLVDDTPATGPGASTAAADHHGWSLGRIIARWKGGVLVERRAGNGNI